MSGFARLLAGAFAPILLFAIVCQGWFSTRDFIHDGGGALGGVWRYLGYFTVLTNVLVCASLARAAAVPDRRDGLNSPRMELLIVASILFVGAVYNLLLASLWDPQGLRKVNDVILHDAAPLLMLAFWLLRPRGGLKWRDAGFAAIWPTLYSIYGLTRGAFDGYYPYFFMNPSTTPLPQLALNMAALIATFVVGAAVLVALDRFAARRTAISR